MYEFYLFWLLAGFSIAGVLVGVVQGSNHRECPYCHLDVTRKDLRCPHCRSRLG